MSTLFEVNLEHSSPLTAVRGVSPQHFKTELWIHISFIQSYSENCNELPLKVTFTLCSLLRVTIVIRLRNFDKCN